MGEEERRSGEEGRRRGREDKRRGGEKERRVEAEEERKRVFFTAGMVSLGAGRRIGGEERGEKVRRRAQEERG